MSEQGLEMCWDLEEYTQAAGIRRKSVSTQAGSDAESGWAPRPVPGSVSLLSCSAH